MARYPSLLLRWLTASALAILSYLLNQQAPEPQRWADPWLFPAIFLAAVTRAAFAMAWLPGERLPWSRMPKRVAVLLVASLVEAAILFLAMLAWIALAWVGWLIGGFVGGVFFLWVLARLLPLGPVVLLFELGPVASVGAAWNRSRGTALVGGSTVAMAVGLLGLLVARGPSTWAPPLVGVLALPLLGGLSAWAYRAGPVVEGDGPPLEPEDRPVGIEGITPSRSEVEWERASP